jgi:hypothetical protein
VESFNSFTFQGWLIGSYLPGHAPAPPARVVFSCPSLAPCSLLLSSRLQLPGLKSKSPLQVRLIPRFPSSCAHCGTTLLHLPSPTTFHTFKSAQSRPLHLPLTATTTTTTTATTLSPPIHCPSLTIHPPSAFHSTITHTHTPAPSHHLTILLFICQFTRTRILESSKRSVCFLLRDCSSSYLRAQR